MLRFLSKGTAHDINNLLALVLVNIHTALSRPSGDASVRHQLMAVREAVSMAGALARQLYVFADGTQQERIMVSVSKLVEELVSVLGPSISDTILVLDLDLELPLIEGAPTQLQRVVLNLIVNAHQALQGEGGTISIRTGQIALDQQFETRGTHLPDGLSNGDYVFIEVTDTGCGLSAEQKREFFTRKREGSGFGVPVVLDIVADHGGVVSCSSEIGAGTSFRVLLPLCEHLNLFPGGQKKGGSSLCRAS